MKACHHVLICLGATLLCAGLGAALTGANQAEAADMVRIQRDHSLRLALKGQAASVVVGNPKIADVTVVDSRTVYIMGRGAGMSEVTVLDNFGRVLWNGEVMVTLAQANNITLYRGTKAARFVCTQVCEEQVADPSDPNAGASIPTSGPAPVSYAAPDPVSSAANMSLAPPANLAYRMPNPSVQPMAGYGVPIK